MQTQTIEEEKVFETYEFNQKDNNLDIENRMPFNRRSTEDQSNFKQMNQSTIQRQYTILPTNDSKKNLQSVLGDSTTQQEVSINRRKNSIEIQEQFSSITGRRSSILHQSLFSQILEQKMKQINEKRSSKFLDLSETQKESSWSKIKNMHAENKQKGGTFFLFKKINRNPNQETMFNLKSNENKNKYTEKIDFRPLLLEENIVSRHAQNLKKSIPENLKQQEVTQQVLQEIKSKVKQFQTAKTMHQKYFRPLHLSKKTFKPQITQNTVHCLTERELMCCYICNSSKCTCTIPEYSYLISPQTETKLKKLQSYQTSNFHSKYPSMNLFNIVQDEKDTKINHTRSISSKNENGKDLNTKKHQWNQYYEDIQLKCNEAARVKVTQHKIKNFAKKFNKKLNDDKMKIKLINHKLKAMLKDKDINVTPKEIQNLRQEIKKTNQERQQIKKQISLEYYERQLEAYKIKIEQRTALTKGKMTQRIELGQL